MERDGIEITKQDKYKGVEIRILEREVERCEWHSGGKIVRLCDGT